MNVVRFNDVNAFAQRAEPYLLPREAEHNLSFGLLSNVKNDPEHFPEAVFALVEDDGEIVLVALRTNLERALILSLAARPEAVELLASDFYAAGLLLTGVNGPAEESRAYAEAWSRLSGLTHRVNVPMRTFKLEKVEPVTGVPGSLRRATEADRSLLARWELDFNREAFPDEESTIEEAEQVIDQFLHASTRGIYVWDDGGAVSFAGYGGPTPHGIRIGPVYTPPEKRGHGYASACVAGMSQLLLDGGRSFCFLFTDVRNPTSNHIYQQIGYRYVCDFTAYSFGRA